MSDRSDRDLELGAALRHALDPGDPAVFVARVLARIDTAPVTPMLWDLLAAWARRGIPAAITIAALTAFLLALPRQPSANLEDTLSGTSAGASLMASPESPDAALFMTGP
jgi:hypothetical protein